MMVIRYILGRVKYFIINNTPLKYSDKKKECVAELIYKYGMWYQPAFIFIDSIEVGGYENRAETFRELDYLARNYFEGEYYDDGFYYALVFSCFNSLDEFELYENKNENTQPRKIGFI